MGTNPESADNQWLSKAHECVRIDNALCRTRTLLVPEGAKGLRSPFSLGGGCLEGRCG